MDYPSTTSYYWPDIAENVTQVFCQVKYATKCNGDDIDVMNFEKGIFQRMKILFSQQISNDGLDTWEPEPAKGPFGFNAALMLDGTQVCKAMW